MPGVVHSGRSLWLSEVVTGPSQATEAARGDGKGVGGGARRRAVARGGGLAITHGREFRRPRPRFPLSGHGRPLGWFGSLQTSSPGWLGRPGSSEQPAIEYVAYEFTPVESFITLNGKKS